MLLQIYIYVYTHKDVRCGLVVAQWEMENTHLITSIHARTHTYPHTHTYRSTLSLGKQRAAEAKEHSISRLSTVLLTLPSLICYMNSTLSHKHALSLCVLHICMWMWYQRFFWCNSAAGLILCVITPITSSYEGGDVPAQCHVLDSCSELKQN